MHRPKYQPAARQESVRNPEFSPKMAAKKPVQLRKKLVGGQQSAQQGNRNVRAVARCEADLCNLSEEQIQSSAIYRLLEEEMRVMASRQAVQLSKMHKVVAVAAVVAPQEGAIQYEGADLVAQERGHVAQVIDPGVAGGDGPSDVVAGAGGGAPAGRLTRIHYYHPFYRHSAQSQSSHHSLLLYSRFQKESPTQWITYTAIPSFTSFIFGVDILAIPTARQCSWPCTQIITTAPYSTSSMLACSFMRPGHMRFAPLSRNFRAPQSAVKRGYMVGQEWRVRRAGTQTSSMKTKCDYLSTTTCSALLSSPAFILQLTTLAFLAKSSSICPSGNLDHRRRLARSSLMADLLATDSWPVRSIFLSIYGLGISDYLIGKNEYLICGADC